MNQNIFLTKVKNLRRTLVYVTLVCVVFSSFAANPQQASATIPKIVNFQGKLTKTSDGTNVANGSYAFEFKLYDALTSGSLLWTETFDQASGDCAKLVVTNAVFNAKLGSCNALTGVDFTTGSLYLSVNFAPTGTSYDGEMSPRKQFVSAPFAFVANSLNGDGNIDLADFDVDSDGKTTIAPDTAGDSLTISTTASADIQGIVISSSNSTQTAGIIQVTSDTVTTGAVLGMALTGTVQDAAAGLTVYGNKTTVTVDTDAGQSHTVYGDHITIANNDASSTAYGLYVDAGTGAGTEYTAAFMNGNVGIGTTSPTFGLDVNNTARITPTTGGNTTFNSSFGAGTNVLTIDNTTSGNSSVLRISNSGAGSQLDLYTGSASLATIRTNTATDLQFKTNNSEVMRLTSGGNVGIGDTTPTAALTVGSGDLFQVNSSGAIAAATGITSSGTINFSGLTASSAVYTDGSKNLTSTAPTSGALGYWSRSGTTLQPATANDVISISGNSGDIATIASSATGSANKALNVSQTGATSGTDYAGYFSNTGAATTNVGLYATATGATNNYAAIFESGNVGIGTTTPGGPLSVLGTASTGVRVFTGVESSDHRVTISARGAEHYYAAETGPRFKIGDGVTGGGRDGLGFTYAGQGTLAAIGAAIDSPALRTLGFWISDGASLTERMRLDSNGNLGINNTSPAAKLDAVNATIANGAALAKFTGTTTTSTASGTAYGLYNSFTNANTTNADTAYSIYNTVTDATALANTVYGDYSDVALSGNAAKTGIGQYLNTTTSSTTADTTIGLDVASTVSGIMTTGTRNVYGVRLQPTAGAESTGGTTNVYGAYIRPSADVGAGGTVNGYGLYIANGTYDTDGTSSNTGLYVESPTGADTNYAAIFAGGNVGIGDTSPASLLTVGASDAFQIGTTGTTLIGSGQTDGGTGAKLSVATGIYTPGYIWATGGLTLTASNKIIVSPDSSTAIQLTGSTGIQMITGGGYIRYLSSTGFQVLRNDGTTLGQMAVGNLSVGSTTATTGGVANFTGNVGFGDTSPAAALTVGSGDLFQVNSSGAIAAATGITSSGTINFSGLSASGIVYTDGSKNLTSTAPTSGTLGYWSRTGTTLQPATANDVISISGNSGDIATLASSATGSANKTLNVSQTGATSGTDYAGYFSNTGAATTNVGLYATATGATNNYAAIFESGYVGIGTTTPTTNLDINTTNNVSLQISSNNTTGTAIRMNNSTAGAHNYEFFVTGSANTAGNFGVYDATINNTPLAIFGGTTSSAGQFVKTSSNAVIGWSNTATSATQTGDTGFSRLSANTIAVGNATQGDFSGTLIATNVGIGDSSPAAALTVGSGDLFQVNSSGAIAAVVGITNTGAQSTTVSSATALTVAKAGTDYALQVDTVTASAATGLKITSAAAASGVALAAISSGTNENITIDAKGSGTVSIGASSTGDVLLGGGSGSTGCTVTNSTGAFACTAGGSLTTLGLTGAITGATGFNGLVITANTGVITSGTWNGTALTDAYVSDTLTASLFSGSGSTTTAVDLATAEVAGTLAVGNGGTGATSLADLITLGTHTTGNYVTSITNGSGISGGNGGSEGAALTLALGALSADWSQTGAFDVTLNNAASELKILESAGGAFYGIFDVTDLSADRTMTVPDASGTLITTGNLSSITTVGTISSGTWNGTAISSTYGGTGINTSGSTGVPYITGGTWSVDATALAANHGGTGQSSYTTGDILYASSSSALSKLAGVATGSVLVSGGVGVAPAWSAAITVTTSVTSATINATSALQLGGTSINTAGTLSNVAYKNAANTFTANNIFQPTVTTGTGTTAGLQVAANSLTTGNGVDISSTSLTTGNLVYLNSTSTAAGSNAQTVLNVATSGANGTSTQTTYGGYFTNTHTGTSSTNVAGYFSASGGTNNYAAIFNAGSVGIGTTAPTANLELASTATTGTGQLITASSITTGKALALVGPSSTGVTGGGFMTVAADVGSGGTQGILASFSPDFSAASATSGYGVAIQGTDSTSSGNSDVNLYSALTLTGNAAKTGFGSYITVSSSSTTADTLYANYNTTTATGAISSGTRTIIGVAGVPTVTAANTGGTTSIYGGNFTPSSTGSTTGSTVNVYGNYIANTATLTTGGTINSYGLYIGNSTMNTTGTSTQYGLYIDTPTGADTNYGAYIGGFAGIGTNAPVSQLHVVANTASNTSGLRLDSSSSNGTNLQLYNNNSTGVSKFIRVMSDSSLQVVNSAYSAALLTLTDGGNMGIGMSPTYKLDVAGDIRTSGTFRGTCNVDPAFSDFDCADYAEIYDSVAPVAAGEVLAVSSVGGKKVEKSSKGYQKSLLGVVSTNPGALLDGTNFLAGGTASATNNPMRPAVALVGRVPVKVTMENGPIVPGDYITSSATTAGYAMKATRSGQVIGQAIESFDGSNPAKQTVVIYVKPGYQFINNTFVLEDGEQLANTNNPTPPEQVGTLVINQKGSGSILQVQKESTDRLLLTNEGTFLLSASASTGNVFEIKNNDTSLLAISHTGMVTAQGTIFVKKDLVVLGKILGSTAIVAKNTSSQDIHQGDLLMLTGATEVPTLGEQPTITVAPAISSETTVIVGIADRNLSDFNIDESLTSTDPTVIKPGEFMSVVITGTYKQVAVTGTVSLGDKLTASTIAGKAQKLESSAQGQIVGVSLDIAPSANNTVRVMLISGFQQSPVVNQIVSQSPPDTNSNTPDNSPPPTEENTPNPEG